MLAIDFILPWLWRTDQPMKLPRPHLSLLVSLSRDGMSVYTRRRLCFWICAEIFGHWVILYAEQGAMHRWKGGKKRVNWIGTITTFISWRYAITIYYIGDMPSRYLFSLLGPTRSVFLSCIFPYRHFYPLSPSSATLYARRGSAARRAASGLIGSLPNRACSYQWIRSRLARLSACKMGLVWFGLKKFLCKLFAYLTTN